VELASAADGRMLMLLHTDDGHYLTAVAPDLAEPVEFLYRYDGRLERAAWDRGEEEAGLALEVVFDASQGWPYFPAIDDAGIRWRCRMVVHEDGKFHRTTPSEVRDCTVINGEPLIMSASVILFNS
jgi:hypothetical protein